MTRLRQKSPPPPPPVRLSVSPALHRRFRLRLRLRVGSLLGRDGGGGGGRGGTCLLQQPLVFGQPARQPGMGDRGSQQVANGVHLGLLGLPDRSGAVGVGVTTIRRQREQKAAGAWCTRRDRDVIWAREVSTVQHFMASGMGQ